ncbi:hypothetical protein [Lacticaseibacillus rhamnosus]|uniref:hypothetical protein n=1 Tax=Lacticaseibacillus rhamnosus TaxID=47715 RepID=UPI00115B5E88|nr:hypothetical protein [Lacticaseibacillus rhamnosus]
MKNNKVSIDIFSSLANIGWALTLLRAVNIISTPWHAILGYWLVTALTVTATTIIGILIDKVGGHSAK